MLPDLRSKLYFILKDKIPVPIDNIIEWALWMDEHQLTEGRIGDDTINGIRVSTVFIGINTSLKEPPELFETGIFTPNDLILKRTCSWGQAEALHKDTVEKLKRRTKSADTK